MGGREEGGRAAFPLGPVWEGGSLSKTATPLGCWVHLTSPPLNTLHLLARALAYRSHQEPREPPPPPPTLPLLLLKTAVVAVGVGGSGQPGQPACKPELERALLEEAPEPG